MKNIKTITNGFNKLNISHFLLAVIIAANPLTWVLNIPYSLAIIVVSSSFFIFILNFRALLSRVNIKSIGFIVYVLLFFLLSFFRNSFQSQTKEYFYEFLVLGILPIMIALLDFDLKKLLIFVVFIGLLFAPYAYTFDIEKFDYSEFDNFFGFIMGVSYGLLRFLVASLVLLFFFRNSLKFKILLVIEVISISLFLLLFGTRGAIVSVIFLLIIIIVLRKAKDVSNQKILKTLFSSGFLILGVLFFFVLVIYPILQSHGIEFIFIDKTMNLAQEGDITSSRDNLFLIAINGIIDSPIIGNCIGSFDNYSGLYTHNLFTNFLYEGGLLLGIPFFYLVFKSIHIILSNSYLFEYRLLILFLLFSSVVELLFSSQPWISQIFWLYIGFILMSNKNKSLTKINENIIHS